MLCCVVLWGHVGFALAGGFDAGLLCRVLSCCVLFCCGNTLVWGLSCLVCCGLPCFAVSLAGGGFGYEVDGWFGWRALGLAWLGLAWLGWLIHWGLAASLGIFVYVCLVTTTTGHPGRQDERGAGALAGGQGREAHLQPPGAWAPRPHTRTSINIKHAAAAVQLNPAPPLTTYIHTCRWTTPTPSAPRSRSSAAT